MQTPPEPRYPADPPEPRYPADFILHELHPSNNALPVCWSVSGASDQLGLIFVTLQTLTVTA